MVKKYLLSVADWATISGFGIGILPLLLGGLVFNLIGQPVLAGVFLLAAFPVGIVLAAIQTYCRKKHISHTSDFLDFRGPRGRLQLLRVRDGRVVEVGTALWGKEGIYPVSLPTVWKGNFDVPTVIVREIAGIEFALDVDLVCRVDAVRETALGDGFDPQELYDKIIVSGGADVTLWLAESFARVAGETPAVRRALEEFETGSPYALVAAVQKALPQVPFNWSLSNIAKVEGEVVVESASFVANVVYQ